MARPYIHTYVQVPAISLLLLCGDLRAKGVKKLLGVGADGDDDEDDEDDDDDDADGSKSNLPLPA